jgi:DNA-binding NtrC family response regulator
MPPSNRDIPLELQSLVRQLHGAHIVIDADYRIVAANDAYRESFMAGGEVVGRHCYEASHGYAVPCDQAGETCPRRRALASGHFERALHVHHTPRGDEYVQVDLYPLLDARGGVSLFVEHISPVASATAARSSTGLVGRAPSFVTMMEHVARVAHTDTAVLLLGETGTGKEMVARAIHEASARAHAPFVAVDCSGLTETLVESELFGHEKGAFTGALVRKAGLVEAAAGGTLFLDEVGDIPLGLQVKLLRLLETGTFRRVGSVEPQHASFRLIAATHRDLVRRVREEQFRADLYYRLAAFPIRLPPLRERREDVALLADSLLSRLGTGHARALSDEALDCLQRYDYPGNIRELRNILERANLLADGPVIERRHLPPEIDAPATVAERSALLDQTERRTLAWAVAAHTGTRRELAEALGISERTLYRKLRLHRLL